MQPAAAALQLASPGSRVPPHVAGQPSSWSSSTVNAVLQRLSSVRRGSVSGGMSATTTPTLAWRDSDSSSGAVEEPRSPDQRRLEGLFAIDPNDFAPEYNFDFTRVREEDEESYTRGGQAYYRPIGWKRFALDVGSRYGLADLPIKDLKQLLCNSEGRRPNTSGLERAELVRMAEEAGGDEYAQAWLGGSNAPGEWINAYHGTAGDVAGAIARSGLRRGRSEGDEDEGVERRNGAVFGAGVYCTPRVEHASLYSEPIEVSADVDGVVTTKYYQVIFQCRVRGPPCASHAEAVSNRGFYNVGMGTEGDVWSKDYWVVPNQKDVRPYAVLMKDCTDDY
jgi:hypothetical protein